MSSKELYLHFSKPTITEKLKLQRVVVTEILGVLLSIAVWKEHCVEQVDSVDIIYIAVRGIVFVSFFSAIACQQFDSVKQVARAKKVKNAPRLGKIKGFRRDRLVSWKSLWFNPELAMFKCCNALVSGVFR